MKLIKEYCFKYEIDKRNIALNMKLIFKKYCFKYEIDKKNIAINMKLIK